MWLVLSLMVQIMCPMLNPRGHQRGKILTAPLRKTFPKLFDHFFCRLFQIFILFGVYTVMKIVGLPEAVAGPIYFILLILLYLDDYFTNDDNHKKWWAEVRNKIKWKMELPAPVPAGSKVGS